MLNFMKDRTDEQKDQPFFAYLPFTAPHWPLHAPEETREKYKGKYDDGPLGLRGRRLESLIKKGLVPADVEPAPLHMLGTTAWAELPEEERKKSCRTMETFAAMVDLIDVNVGRVVDYLKETGELDNTFIAFMSDNGAEGQLLEAVPILAGATMADVLEKYYDNSLDNIGNHNSFVWYGPQWASASMAPSRGAKSYTTEGGIHCPCIIRYPPLLKQTGLHTDTFTTVMDILPTVLELAGIKHPGTSFRGREVVIPRGESWTKLLAQPGDSSIKIYDDSSAIVGWEQLAIAAVRKGDWKALFLPPPRGLGRWELYNLANDLGEVHDLSEEMPEKMNEMIAYYETYYQGESLSSSKNWRKCLTLYVETGMFDAYAMFQAELNKAGIKRAW
jgi:arylsulfatase